MEEGEDADLVMEDIMDPHRAVYSLIEYPGPVDPRDRSGMREWERILRIASAYIDMYAHGVRYGDADQIRLYSDFSTLPLFSDMYTKLCVPFEPYDALDDGWPVYPFSFRMHALGFVSVFYVYSGRLDVDLLRSLIRSLVDSDIASNHDVYLPPNSVPWRVPAYAMRAHLLISEFVASARKTPVLDDVSDGGEEDEGA